MGKTALDLASSENIRQLLRARLEVSSSSMIEYSALIDAYVPIDELTAIFIAYIICALTITINIFHLLDEQEDKYQSSTTA